MSAPLVVNTRDGAVWTRRAVTRDGVALYALADVCRCPEYVMATLVELAERGIVGSADALPVPMGAQEDQRTELARLRAERHETNAALAEVTLALRAAEAERDAWRDQRNDVFATNVQLHARVEESGEARLRAENEFRVAVRELAQLRARLGDGATPPVAVPFPPRGARCACGHSGADHHHAGTACWGELSRLRAADGTVGPVRLCDCTAFESVSVVIEPDSTRFIESTTKLRQLLVRPRAAVEDPHDSPLHHPYELGRDLPEPGVSS
ncbi:hypothetical protein [Streptomyces sp. NPDC023838]|uniref:hypothetical protein n=1 Tax=Streptomyces sp. NPDC023838 TaxID=3154325 RepID=UPI0034083F66